MEAYFSFVSFKDSVEHVYVLGGSDGKASACNVGDQCLTRSGSSPGEGNGTPVLLPGKSRGQRSLVGYGPWGRKESDMTERLHFHFSLLLGRKDMTNLDSIFKSRDITLPTKVCLVKAMVFPVVMYRFESCIVKKAEH